MNTQIERVEYGEGAHVKIFEVGMVSRHATGYGKVLKINECSRNGENALIPTIVIEAEGGTIEADWARFIVYSKKSP